MPIQVRCPGCNRVRNVPDEWAGRTATCNDCHATMTIPVAMASAPRPAMPPAPPSPPPVLRSPPPVPPSAPPPVPRAEDVLAGYGQAPRPMGANLKAKAKGLFDDVGKWVKALKLQHDVKTLQTAIEAQLETLGKLALTHRPAGLDFQQELAKLGYAQSERGRKQAELNALAQTPGSGAASKQLKRELSELATHERQLMIAIGRSAATVRPEMPDGAAQYGALERLNATLAARQQEIRTLQAERAAGGGAGLSGINWQKPALLAGGIGAVLIVGYLLFAVLLPALFGGGGVPAWAAYYIPEGSKGVAYANVDELRKSELFSSLEKQVKSRTQAELRGIDFDPADASEVFVAGGDEPLVLVRMRKDCTLKSLLPKDQRERVKPKTYKNVEYVQVPMSGSVVAKTADRTFCFAPKEDMLKDAVSRVDRKERAKLDTKLQASLAAVAGGDFYFAGTNPGKKELPFEPEAFHAQVWLGSSVEIRATVAFAKSENAEAAKKMADAGLAMASNAPPQIKPLLTGITIKQSGKYLYGSGKWKTKDLKDLLAKAGDFPFPF